MPESRYLEAGGGDDPYFIEYAKPALECWFEVDGNTYNEVVYDGLIAQVTELPPDAKTTIFISNQTIVNQINGDCQTHEERLIPLVERLRDLLEERPRIRIAFMPKPELMANIRAIKAEIAKREAEAAVDPDESAYLDYTDEDSVCPW